MNEKERFEDKDETKPNLLESLLMGNGESLVHNRQEISVRIKALLMLRNVSQAAIAEKYQISKSDLCKVINGKRRTKHIRNAIAHELNIPADLIWRKY